MKFFLCLFAGLLGFAATLTAETNLLVAADGSAKFKSVQEAIMSVPSGTRENPVFGVSIFHKSFEKPLKADSGNSR